METTAQDDLKPNRQNAETAEQSRSRLSNLVGLAGVMVLAAGLRLANLYSLGLANHYYAAAVKSMLLSWHNFFFVAAEPGGSVSVDKPPVGLWLQVLSARIFGVTTLGLLLPQLIAGLLSVLLVYHLVRRRFGPYAGLIAGLVLAVTPVVVATDRNNTMDSTLIFTLLLAAWAFIKASETSRFKYLMVGAILVGIAFNIKMLEAYLPLPAFLAMYLLGSQEGLLRKLGKLGLTTLLILVISLSWAVAVDATPASQRPYVGSSSDNSEFSLIIGYNGLQRLLGMFGGRGGRNGVNQAGPGTNPPNRGFFQSPHNSGDNPNVPPDGISPGAPRPQNLTGSPPGGNPGIGFSATGQAGPLRLFIPPLSKEAGWLLPLALFCLVMLLVTARLTWPIAAQHQAAVVWGGWLITAGVFFSIAGFFHEYYLSTLAPPLAALVGAGVITSWQYGKRRPWVMSSLFIAITSLTLLLQYNTAIAFLASIPWLPLVLGLLGLGIALLLTANLLRSPIRKRCAVLGTASLVAAMLVTPLIWSALTNRYSAENQSLPSAYVGGTSSAGNSEGLNVDINLLDLLQANTQGVEYLMAVPSSMQGADYILATGRPVLYMGGFMGQDEVLTPESLAKLVADGKLRYIYWNTLGGSRPGGGAFGGQSLITSWVASNCQVVQAFNTATSNFGEPDVINRGIGGNTFPGRAQPVVLYDCAQ